MLIKTIPVGQIETNCYVVTDENTLACAVIDPGAESNTILDYIERNGLSCRAVFITHGHYDHTMAARAVAEETGAQIRIHRLDTAASAGDAPFRLALTEDMPPLPLPQDSSIHPFCFITSPEDARFYAEGDEIVVGGLTFRVLETPGHSPGGVTLLCEDALFTGDTLFRGDCGRTDLPGGNENILKASLRRLYNLPGDYEVYPGHMDSSTLERERRFNGCMLYAMEQAL
ncbi:MAG: MBL fold metallo-hydrolase [Firmicutes bacterium]|nr:MBL fold metallo-hydrolase [Bacillota bacterium]